MECSSCKRGKEIVARGLCNACYQRWRKTGTTEYQRWGKHPICEIHGCKGTVAAQNLCQKHYMRVYRHGHTDETRPDSWGAIEKHPLRNSWQWMRRYKSRTPVCQEWQNDFLQFVMDVGERPSSKHKLFAADETKPIGPRNFVWKRAVTEQVQGEDKKTYAARRQRIYRALKNEEFRGYETKKRYGLSRSQYEAMLATQGKRCAICGKEETAVIRGRKLRLAIDHCHVSGSVRELLCGACNNMLGAAKDSIDILEKAIQYLKKHQALKPIAGWSSGSSPVS